MGFKVLIAGSALNDLRQIVEFAAQDIDWQIAD